ncbi:factor H binding protein domain-containing protein [Neisseria dumasiana]|uniref:Factor H binding protein-like C-terminal domain-containing protein n=1 Tax=Neisseria dumasiana TaxID=1931275 RepID=A0ABX3WQU4_9NEIS|nr:factor H binding protein domain-containing protein [Neisseria dumasiana]OSI36484.1 hypothetical protein BV913_01855 [Neisseria dumasiana]UOO84024.1 factor H binding family protein [Neisseria dumasiana]
MSIHKKIALATLITLGMAACGGGGSGSPSTAATSHADIQGVKAALAAENTNKEEAKKTSQNLSDYTVTLAGVQHNVGKMAKNELVEGVNGKEAFRAYRQAYSVVAGSFALQPTTGGDPDDNSPDMKMPMQVKLINGEATQTLPTAGKYTYNGAAFSNSETGRLTYNVDFDKKVGSGKITGINETGTIDLHETAFSNGAISNAADSSKVVVTHAIEGKTHSEKLGEGDYNLSFFGPKAEEIAGQVFHKKGEIGVIGKRD